jgi:hypothetical protein
VPVYQAMKLNIHSYGVLHGLGWVIVLADGWILHWHWLGASGLILLVWTLWRMNKEIKDGF